ncbi:PilW family protein [Microbulbifer guangxiensis]|uniref:PilW family protein n=1 Tax=Microbulbifer guangxiensis TaxID=2904249 RepID=UPI001F420294|nr:PilW family protein [Microbulbifer guangxiensis]
MDSLQKQNGLSLIELMIALLLSAILLMGVLQIFDGNRRTQSLQESLARIQESGRMATDLLTKELRGAAFDGCVIKPSLMKNHTSPSISLFEGSMVDGADGVGVGLIIGDKTVEGGTDVLRVRGARDACAGMGRVDAANSGSNQLQLRGSCPGIAAGDYLMVANCRAGDITSVVSVAGSPPLLTTDHSFNATYGKEAQVFEPYVREYFISRADAGGLPGLFVSENGQPAEEIMPGVEDLQILFGRDAGNGDNIVDIWGGPPANLVESEQVAAIRFQLMVAASDRVGADAFSYRRLGETIETSAPDDGRLRKIYSVLTKLRNRGSR